MRLFGLIGYPLSHSFSKKYFTEKFEREGMKDCRYELFSIPDVSNLQDILTSNPDLAGLNVTIPYKKSVISFLDDLTHLPEGLNACNCIKISEGKLSGFNTDITGFKTSFQKSLLPHHTKALILGKGGAAEAVAYALRSLNISFLFVTRQAAGEDSIRYDRIDKQLLNDYSIVINTTPVGTFPAIDICPEIPYKHLTRHHYLFDLVYNPEKSMFLSKGESHGAAIRNGYEMLEIQAEESWKIWNE